MRIKTIILAMALSHACMASAAQQDHTQQRSELPGDDYDTVSLGTAYHSENGTMYSFKSVNGIVTEELGNTEIDFSAGVDMSYEQLSNMLDGSLGAQLDVPAVKVGVGASYAKQNASDDYTGTYTFYLTVKPKKRVLIPETDAGFQPTQAALDIVYDEPGNKFANIGNEFVSAIEYGSQVMVNLKFQYKNKEDKVKWGGQLDVDWVGKVKVSGSLEKVDNETKRNIKVTVQATQSGGDQNALLQIIPNRLAECNMENPTPCFDIFENTIQYAKNDYINQFPTLDDYNVTKVYTQTYKHSGTGLDELTPDGPYPTATILTRLSVQSLSDDWVQAILDNRRAANLLSYYASELSSSHRAILETIRDDAQFNSFILADAVAYCKQNPIGPYCRTRELQTLNAVRSYDRNNLEL